MIANIPKKILIIFGVLILLIAILVGAQMALKPNQPKKSSLEVIYKEASTPQNNMPNQASPTPKHRQLSTKTVQNIRWLNNAEIVYTYLDFDKKQLFLLKNDGEKEAVLVNNPEIKYSEIYWSKDNDLLIFDYGTPYKTYIYRDGQLRELGFSGYGFSWNPNGRELFFKDVSIQGAEQIKIYNKETSQATTLNIDLPPFVASYFSPKGSGILLYNFNFETGAGSLNKYSFESSSTTLLTQKQINSPSWSPEGDKVAYLSEGGLYLFIDQEQVVYQSSSKTSNLSYLWLDNNQILVADTEKGPMFKVVSLNSSTKEVFQDLQLQELQKIGFSLSPDNEVVAISTEKDGVWAIKNPLR